MDIINLEHFQKKFIEKIDNLPGPQTGFGEGVLPGGGLATIEEAFLIYKNSHKLKLVEALQENYVGTKKRLGSELFNEVCIQFIECFHSTFYNLSEYGEAFPSFLKSAVSMHKFPYIEDLARFDWAYARVFECSQHCSLAVEELEKVMLNYNVRLIFGPSVSLFQSRYPILHLWLSDKEINLRQGQNSYFFYKLNGEVYINELSPVEFVLFKSLLNGCTLQKILDIIDTEQVHELFHLFQLIGESSIVSEIVEI